ncbi:MAG: entericidin EcnA/B family protein [Alkalilacustris sp.]
MPRTCLAAALALTLTAGAVAGCNTVEGVGMDISSGARTVGGWFSGN